MINKLNNQIASAKNSGFDTNKISDGYHSFGQLYDFRLAYNLALFNEWASQNKNDVHKAKKFQDGVGGKWIEWDGWFIVMAETPNGQISQHYSMEDWDKFNCQVRERCNDFDGHDSKEIINRLSKL